MSSRLVFADFLEKQAHGDPPCGLAMFSWRGALWLMGGGATRLIYGRLT
jgi:hypothetical protein